MIRVESAKAYLTVGQLRAICADLPDDQLVVLQDQEGGEYPTSSNVITDAPVRVRRLTPGPDPYTQGWTETVEHVLVLEMTTG